MYSYVCMYSCEVMSKKMNVSQQGGDDMLLKVELPDMKPLMVCYKISTKYTVFSIYIYVCMCICMYVYVYVCM